MPKTHKRKDRKGEHRAIVIDKKTSDMLEKIKAEHKLRSATAAVTWALVKLVQLKKLREFHKENKDFCQLVDIVLEKV